MKVYVCDYRSVDESMLNCLPSESRLPLDEDLEHFYNVKGNAIWWQVEWDDDEGAP